jgi:SAM-dependent methyltransferase
MKTNSILMSIFLSLGMKRLAWAFRRLHCPVPKDALVLEVGSGGNPYFRANVLVDAYTTTRERHWAPLITDRPSVIGFGESLPFKDKAFDFVIASHVLEHSSEPEKFINELERVSKAGYIETPDAFMERINPYWDHRSEVTDRNGELLIRKKNDWNIDADLVSLYEFSAKKIIALKTIVHEPFVFHTRFYWKHKIPYKILNPKTDSSWPAPVFPYTTKLSTSMRAKIGQFVLYLARLFLSQNKRNRRLNLESLLICPSCKSQDLVFEIEGIQCTSCSCTYQINYGVPDMTQVVESSHHF